MSKLMFAAALSSALLAGTAAFASPASDACMSAGGTYTKAPGSTATCVYPATTKDVSGNAYGTATQDTTTGQGNLGNRTATTCSGNTGQCKK